MRLEGRTMRKVRVGLAGFATLALTFGLIACGSSAPSTVKTTAGGKLAQPTNATLVLDFVPNAVHAGIYRAVAAGYYKDANINLKIIKPTSTADTLKLIDAGKAQFGIADGIDVASQIEAGSDAKGIMALLERPPGGLITLKSSGFTSPKQLDGKTIGITGVPSDSAIYKTEMTAAGGDPSSATIVTVGFNGVTNLQNKKIDAFTGFVPADGVQVQQDGFPITAFPLYKWGGPTYPGLVVFSTTKRIAQEPALMSAFVAATIKGYEDTFKNPQQSINDLVSENPGLDAKLAKASLAAYMPLFKGNAPVYGEFVTKNLQDLSNYLVKTGLGKSPISPTRYGTNQFVPGAGSGG